MGKNPNLPQILLTHCCIYGLPPEQTGFAEPHHCPTAAFTDQISSFVAGNPSIKCVLSGHNHMNMRVNHGGVEFATVSSLVETPFEFKLFEVTSKRMQMTTVALGSTLEIDAPYDDAKSFVQGRPVDRSFTSVF